VTNRLALLLFCFLFSIYLVTYSPRFHSSDGLAMFSMAESLVRRGESDIDQIRWMGLQQGTFGLDGHLYSRKGVGMSLLLAPLVWLGLAMPTWGAATVALLFNSLVTAATASFLFLAIKHLGYDDRVALVGGLAYGLTTLAWPYAKTCFSDPLAGLSLIVAALALLRFRDSGSTVNALWSGLALALAVSTRYVNAIVVPLFAALLLWYVWQAAGRRTLDRVQVLRFGYFIRDRRTLGALGAFAAPLAATAGLLVLYNVVRYGNPLNTGYLPEESFSGNWLHGIVGLLISPGRGLFLYAPPLLLALPAIPALLRRHRPEALLTWGVILCHLLLYGKWFMWHGGYAWGPRFMVPTLPFFIVGITPVIEWAKESMRWRVTLWALAILGGAIQVLGLSVHFELFQNRLLDTGLPLFSPITFFDPSYSPLIGQFQFLQPVNLDFAWMEQGRADWAVLVRLLAGSLLAGLALVLAMKPPPVWRHGRVTQLGVVALVLAMAGMLAAYAHVRWSADLRDAVALLNARTSASDAIITGTPDEAEAFADLYKGRAKVLGLNVGMLKQDTHTAEALCDVVGRYPNVWWLPNWLPPERNDIERWLMEHGFRVEDRFFPREQDSTDGRRLVQYYFPPRPLAETHIGATFGKEIILDHIAMLRGIESGAVLPVALYWRAMQPVSRNYLVFVHLLDQSGNRVAGSDGQPALWMRPTSGWLTGETIEDRHALMLPDDLAAGDYTVVTGLYLPETGERLPDDQGASFAVLGTVQVMARLSCLPTSCQVNPSAMKAQAPQAISGAACDRCISSEKAAACSAKLDAS
jgi:hypothetical protein